MLKVFLERGDRGMRCGERGLRRRREGADGMGGLQVWLGQ